MTSTSEMPTVTLKDGTELPRFYIANLRTQQLGWTLMDRADEKGEPIRKHRELFYHTSEDVVKLAMQDVLKNKFDSKKYPKLSVLPPMIVQFKEKHGDAHYIYTSREEFQKIFLSVLEERKEQGWYDYYQPEKPKDKDKPTMTVEEINALEDKELKEFWLKRYNKYTRDLKEYEEAKTLQAAIKKAIDTCDGQLAYQILNELKGGEYEGFEIINPIRIDDND